MPLYTSTAARGVKIRAANAGQTALSGVETVIDFNVTDYNDDTSLYTVSLAANTITVANAGLYVVGASVRVGIAAAPGERSSLIGVDGSTVTEFNLPVGAGSPCVLPTTSLLKLAAGAVIDLRLYSTGGDVAVDSDAERMTWLAIAKL
jgi:hypothetical protein